MRARTAVTVRPDGALGELTCQPPLTVRRVHGPAGTCALCLVGSAAGPLPGDEHVLELTVQEGARATLVATGASIAQGRDGAPATVMMCVRVGDGAHLDADPGPLIVCAGARVDVRLSIELARSAHCRWRELVVLGRTGEPGGAATVRWDVTRAGRPVLRQAVDLGSSFAAHRVLATELVTGPEVTATTRVLDHAAVVQRVDEHTELRTVLGSDVADVAARLAALSTADHLFPASARCTPSDRADARKR